MSAKKCIGCATAFYGDKCPKCGMIGTAVESKSSTASQLLGIGIVSAFMIAIMWWHYSPSSSTASPGVPKQIPRPDFHEAIASHEIIIGMTKDQVQQSLAGDSQSSLRGLPTMTTTETPSGKIETWMFEDKEILTFADGTLTVYTH